MPLRAPVAKREQAPEEAFREALAELAQVSHEARLQAEIAGRIDQFARLAHSSLDLKSAAFVIVNEAQRVLGCDRVSLAIRAGRRYPIAAVSGQDTIEPRAELTKAMARLAARVLAFGEPVWFASHSAGDENGSARSVSSPGEWPPEVQDAVQQYVDQAFVKTVAVIPLSRSKPDSGTYHDDRHVKDQRPLGALVVEQIEDQRPQAALAAMIEPIAAHSAQALANALELKQIFLMPLRRRIATAGVVVASRNLPKTVAALVAVIAAVTALIVVPGDFTVSAPGTLRPAVERDVFADVDGVIRTVRVAHGDRVKSGDVLVELDSTDLKVQIADVLGQRQSAAERLSAFNRLRLDGAVAEEEKSRLAGEIAQIQRRVASLDEQLKLLEQKRDRLKVRSPVAGQVVTWDVERQLGFRPVSAGQVLLTIADTDGPWELDLYVPEKRMGHVAAAQATGREGLPVDYITAGDPARTRQGRLRAAQATAELHEEHGHCIRASVMIDAHELADPRPGTEITARIHCGQRAIGYVWLHEAFEFIQSRVLFNLGLYE